MGVRLQRNLGPVSHLEAGEYTVATASGDPAICCPGCGETNDLDMTTHEVSRGGEVGPRWVCPEAACPLIEFLALEHWMEPVV